MLINVTFHDFLFCHLIGQVVYGSCQNGCIFILYKNQKNILYFILVIELSALTRVYCLFSKKVHTRSTVGFIHLAFVQSKMLSCRL
jgi:hypothetical protein